MCRNIPVILREQSPQIALELRHCSYLAARTYHHFPYSLWGLPLLVLAVSVEPLKWVVGISFDAESHLPLGLKPVADKAYYYQNYNQIGLGRLHALGSW